MRLLLAAFVAFVIFVMFAVVNGTKVTVTCGPAVSTPAVVRLLDGAETAGKALKSLRDMYDDGPTPMEIWVFWHRVFNLIGLVGDSFGNALNGKDAPKDAEGLRKAAEASQAAAIASCSCKTPDGNPAPPTPPPFDPRDAALAASFTSSSPEQLARTVARRYFPASQVDTAVAVAGAESRWNPKALSPPNYNGTRDHGLWQINTIHRNLLAAKNWRNPDANAWMAYQVWKDRKKRDGNGWTAWTTYNSGSYRKFLHGGPTAKMPAPEPVLPSTPDPCPTPKASPQAIASSGSMASLVNRRTPAQAVVFMQRMYSRQLDDDSGRCLHWVGMAYGYPTTADNYAIDQWRNAPARYKHPGDRLPPAGALMFWDTGKRAGHVALSAGGGMVFSTDTSARGRVGLHPISYFNGYGKYMGWTDVWFRGQTRTGVQA